MNDMMVCKSLESGMFYTIDVLSPELDAVCH